MRSIAIRNVGRLISGVSTMERIMLMRELPAFSEFPCVDVMQTDRDKPDSSEGSSIRDGGLSPAGNARRRFLAESGALTGGIAAARYAGAASPVGAEVQETTRARV